MLPRKVAAWVVLAACQACASPALACEFASGAKTAALIELYTSEGCSSCPPADRQMRRLREALDPGAQAVPLALHVGYWDYLGWKDPYADPAFAARQEALVRVNRQRTLYTPQFFVNGAELRAARSSLREAVRRVNETPAAADIRLSAAASGKDMLRLRAQANAARRAPLDLYVALTESELASKVPRGENAGVTLEHDHVVRQWLGPVRFTGASAQLERDLRLPGAWNRSHLALAAFVQDPETGRVLQAAGGRCDGF